MFKTTVKYTDFLGGEREEVLRFNLSELEMRDLMSEDPVLNPAVLTAISEANDVDSMFKVIRKLILHSYGEMSEDGRYFRKSKEITSDFAHSAAYEALLNDLMSDDGHKLSDFITGIFPASVAEEVRKATAAQLTVVK